MGSWIGCACQALNDRVELSSGCCTRSQCLYVSHRRCAEETAIFTIELRGAFVADMECDCPRVHIFAQQEASRLMEPQVLLEL